MIAEVDAQGNLKRDPHVVGGQNQGAGKRAGFNKWWGGWSDINSLMDICAKYLKNNPRRRKGNYTSNVQKYARFI